MIRVNVRCHCEIAICVVNLKKEPHHHTHDDEFACAQFITAAMHGTCTVEKHQNFGPIADVNLEIQLQRNSDVR